MKDRSSYIRLLYIFTVFSLIFCIHSKASTYNTLTQELSILKDNDSGYTSHIKVSDDYIFFIALLEERFGYDYISKNLFKENTKKAFYSHGRLSFFLKGKIKGDILLKANYDSDRNDPFFKKIDKDKYYNIYSDNSSTDNINTDKRLFLEIKTNNSSFLSGSYNITEKKGHTYSYSGVHSGNIIKRNFKDQNNSNVELIIFDSDINSKPVLAIIRETGNYIYYVKHKNIVPGSISIKINKVDNTLNTIIHSISLSENDYIIDYPEGRIKLKQAIYEKYLSSDFSYTGNTNNTDSFSNFLNINYNYISQTPYKEKTKGILYSSKNKDDESVIQYIQNENQNNSENNFIFSTTRKLSKDIKFHFEAASGQSISETYYSDDGGITFNNINQTTGNKTASKVNIEGKLGNKTEIVLKSSDTGNSFSKNLGDLHKNTENSYSGITYKADKNTTIKNTYKKNKDLADNSEIKENKTTISFNKDNYNIKTENIDLKKYNKDFQISKVQYTNKIDDKNTLKVSHTHTPDTVLNIETAVMLEHKITDNIYGNINLIENNDNSHETDYNIRIKNKFENNILSGNLNISDKKTSLENGFIKTSGENIQYTTKIESEKDVLGNQKNSIVHRISKILESNNKFSFERFYTREYGDYEPYQNVKANKLTFYRDDFFAISLIDSTTNKENEEFISREILFDSKINNTIDMNISASEGNVEKESEIFKRKNASIALNIDNPYKDRILGITKGKVKLSKSEEKELIKNDLTNGTKRSETDFLDISLEGILNKDSNYSLYIEKQNTHSNYNSVTSNNTSPSFENYFFSINHRPLFDDKLNIFYTYKNSDIFSPIISNQNIYRSKNSISSLTGTYDISENIKFSEKISHSNINNEYNSSTSDNSSKTLIVSKISYYTDPYVYSVSHRSLTDEESGFDINVSKDINEFLSVSAGFNFINYNDNISLTDYNKKGTYFTFSGKYFDRDAMTKDAKKEFFTEKRIQKDSLIMLSSRYFNPEIYEIEYLNNTLNYDIPEEIDTNDKKVANIKKIMTDESENIIKNIIKLEEKIAYYNKIAMEYYKNGDLEEARYILKSVVLMAKQRGLLEK